VESEPGRGSTFRVLLPAAVAARRPAPAEVGAAPGPRLAVLVVDDEPLVAAAVRRGLAAEHDVTVAHGGRAALERLQRGERWDVILTDLLMPDVTGMDLFAAVEARDPGLAARMLFMTGGAFTPASRAFVERMKTRCVVKPFEVSTLGAHFARLAGSPTP
jgi:CheY-like chemotaxis protein